jgi:hypothetical protein
MCAVSESIVRSEVRRGSSWCIKSNSSESRLTESDQEIIELVRSLQVDITGTSWRQEGSELQWYSPFVRMTILLPLLVYLRLFISRLWMAAVKHSKTEEEYETFFLGNLINSEEEKTRAKIARMKNQVLQKQT